MVGSRSLVFVGLCLLALSVATSANGGARSLSSSCYGNCKRCEHGQCKECFSNHYLNEHNKCKQCAECYLDHCDKCECGMCKQCTNGYYWSVEHWACKKCDACGDGCEECECGTCKKCKYGYWLKDGKCVQCGKCDKYCNPTKCDCGTCSGCLPGYKLEHGQCKRESKFIGVASANVKVNGHTIVNKKESCHGPSCGLGVSVSIKG